MRDLSCVFYSSAKKIIDFCVSAIYNKNAPIRMEVTAMGEQKMGRPTDNPKDINLRIRMDRETMDKLIKSAEIMNLTRSETIRRCIHQLYDRLQEK